MQTDSSLRRQVTLLRIDLAAGEESPLPEALERLDSPCADVIQLDARHFQGEEAPGGSALDSVLQLHKFDAIVCDLGTAADAVVGAKLALVIARAGAIPVVVCATDETALEEAFTAGCDGYLTYDELSAGRLWRELCGALGRACNRSRSQQAEQHLRQLIENNSDGLIVVDQDGQVRLVNKATEKLFGQPAEMLIGSSFGAPSTNGGAAEIQTVRHTAVGPETITIEMRVVPIEWEGRPAYLESLRDVTDHKQEMQLAREAVRLRDHFLATLSHELRNPLAVLTNAATILSMDNTAPEMRKQCISAIQNHCSSMTRLLDDLLDISRVWRGKIELKCASISIRDLVREVCQSLGPRFEQKDQEFSLHLPEDDLRIRADQDRVRQVLLNLLVNANKYTPNGGKIRVSLTADAANVRLSVQDTGDGIATDMLESIFEPFIQIGTSLARSDGGLGIGLALVRKLVELHRGTVAAYSDGPGQGSEFVVAFPRTLEGAPAAENSQPICPCADMPQRIVLVEDQQSVRYLTRALLERLGHTVIEAADGVEGVRSIEEHHPDVAIVDIGLPEMDGYQVARHVRQNESTKSVRLIALTGYGQPHHRIQSIQAGFDDHLTKPVGLPELTCAIRPLRNGTSSRVGDAGEW